MPNRITTGPDGNLWFTEFAANKIGRITPSGVITEYAFSPETDQAGGTSGPTRIIAGPDGQLWFTENEPANRVSRVSVAGVVTPGDRWIAAPTGLAVGPDGNVWATVRQADLIRVVSPAGAVLRDHQLPSSFRQHTAPYGITNGPDGNLWFTPGDRQEVWRITPDGATTQYSVPATPVYPIRTGPDGNLWFTLWSQTGQSLGRMSPSGELAVYAVPGATSAFGFGLTVGPDGNLWFTDRATIGRMTLTGAVTLYPIPDAGIVHDVAAGPDGNIWFTDRDNNRIGRFTPPPTPRDYLPVVFVEVSGG